MEERGRDVGLVDRNGRKENWKLSKVMAMDESQGNTDTETERIPRWFLMLKMPMGLGDTEFARLRSETTKSLVRDEILNQRGTRGHRGTPPRKVISDTHERIQILQDLHHNSGHRGRDAIYNKVKNASIGRVCIQMSTGLFSR